MKISLQKTSGFLFFALGTSPLLMVIFFSVRENLIRLQMEKKLESHTLQTVLIPAEKVIWMDEHEIWINESMFDIRTQKLEGGVYTFTGMYDAEETILVLRQQKATKKQTDQDRLLIQLLNCLKNLYSQSPEHSFIALTSTGIHQSFLFLRLPDFVPAIPTPPPQ